MMRQLKKYCLLIQTLLFSNLAVLGLCCSVNQLALATSLVSVGDSITQSNNTQYSWRYALWTHFINDGRQIDFVGSLNDNHNGNPSWPAIGSETFDRDHEGHWGWRIDNILNGYGASTTLSDWLAGYTADIALIHLGTNDMLQNQSLSSTKNELGQVIDTLRSDNPNTLFFVAQLIPTTRPENPNITAFNSEIATLVTEKTTAQSPIILVDQNTGFDPVADTFDGLHPDSSGEQKMADNWYAAMQQNLPECMDGFDNDGDGLFDYPLDTDCVSASGDSESAATEVNISTVTPLHIFVFGVLLFGLAVQARRQTN